MTIKSVEDINSGLWREMSGLTIHWGRTLAGEQELRSKETYRRNSSMDFANQERLKWRVYHASVKSTENGCMYG